MTQEQPITFGSLFAGIGGFDLGFERAGMVCKWQVEIDDYATRVLEKHWPDVTRWRDVRTWPQPGTERVDVICGGFPCQDISYAGKGAGLAGERSGLFFDAVCCIGELGPRVIVLENVAALLTRGLGDVLGTLASIGFDAEWHCIPASSVGAPHRRDRIFVLGRNTNCIEQNQECEVCRWKATKSARSIAVSNAGCPLLESRTSWQRDGRGRAVEQHAGYVSHADRRRLKEREKCNRSQEAGGEAQQRYDALRCGSRDWWATEPAVGRVANGIPSRVDRLRGLGNAVVPQVAEWIGRQVVASLRGDT